MARMLISVLAKRSMHEMCLFCFLLRPVLSCERCNALALFYSLELIEVINMLTTFLTYYSVTGLKYDPFSSTSLHPSCSLARLSFSLYLRRSSTCCCYRHHIDLIAVFFMIDSCRKKHIYAYAQLINKVEKKRPVSRLFCKYFNDAFFHTHDFLSL